MTFVVSGPDERLVKSDERIRDLGEVFTPSATVQAMLDLLPTQTWDVHPSPTFLEPACGDGNFLVAILERKLARIASEYSMGTLPAGPTPEAAQFHALEALAAIYAVDISVENVVGGTPGHEVGARSRLLKLFAAWNSNALGKRMSEKSLALRAADWIVTHNVVVGNMLPSDSAGRPTGRDSIPIIEYAFNPSDMTVSLKKTTIGDVIASKKNAVETEFWLFGPSESIYLWRGKVINLSEARRVEAPALVGEVRNGLGRTS